MPLQFLSKSNAPTSERVYFLKENSLSPSIPTIQQLQIAKGQLFKEIPILEKWNIKGVKLSVNNESFLISSKIKNSPVGGFL